MSIFDRIRTALTGKAPGEQLSEIRGRIAVLEGELGGPDPKNPGQLLVGRIDRELQSLAVPVLTGDQEAERRSRELQSQKEAATAELSTLRQAAAQLVQDAAQKAEAERRAAAEARPHELAVDHQRALDLDDAIDRLSATLAATLRERSELGDRMAAHGGSMALRRGNETLNVRARSAIARHFTINPGQSVSAANNLLGITSGYSGANAHLSLREHDQALFDDQCAFYLSEAEAIAAQQRRKDRGDPTVISRIGNIWTLTSHSAMYATEIEARKVVATQERTGRELVVVRRAPGFVILDKSVAEAVEALADATPAQAA